MPHRVITFVGIVGAVVAAAAASALPASLSVGPPELGAATV